METRQYLPKGAWEVGWGMVGVEHLIVQNLS